MKVKIIDCTQSNWYKDKIGCVCDTIGISGDFYIATFNTYFDKSLNMKVTDILRYLN